MQITIHPQELAAAAAALDRCARDLDDALATATRTGRDNIDHLGIQAMAASWHGLQLTGHAVQVLAEDIDRLAGALRAVAAAYPQIDRAAVPQP